MSRRRATQSVFTFARPKAKRGGLPLPDYEQLVTRLREDAEHIREHFGLPPFHLDADRASAHDRYGLCYDDGRIFVRLVHAKTGKPLKYSALIDTVVHELAHLRHMNHGPRWRALYERMLQWCREQGLYEPRALPHVPASPPGTRQLGLFSAEP